MTNLTPDDNHRSAANRVTPTVSTERTISLSGATVEYLQLPEDVKSALIVADGADVQFWPSYDDGETALNRSGRP